MARELWDRSSGPRPGNLSEIYGGARNLTEDKLGYGVDDKYIYEHPLALTVWIAGILSLFACFACITHRSRRLRQGHTTMCCGRIDISLPPPRQVTPETPAMIAQMIEPSVVEAIEMLPCRTWEGRTTDVPTDDAEAESCALCLEAFETGDEVRRLACAHEFHRRCCDRWLIEALAYKKRRCPLCNLDPLGDLAPSPQAEELTTPTPSSPPSPPSATASNSHRQPHGQPAESASSAGSRDDSQAILGVNGLWRPGRQSSARSPLRAPAVV